MRKAHLFAGLGIALVSALAMAQDRPESILPPGFDRPAARPAQPASPRIEAEPLVQSVPSGASAPAGTRPQHATPAGLPAGGRLPTIDEVEKLSPDDLAELLGLKPKTDMPAAARRAMKQVGVLDELEGGLPHAALANQDASLVAAVLKGNRGGMVSRWGHILLRRALASRLDAPAGMNPADFAAMRAALLVRMGEGEAARALVQDVDTGNYTPQLTQAALDAYVATADFTGICPAVAIQGGARKDPQWQVSRAVCAAFEGEGASAMSQLDRAMGNRIMPRIDLLLAQKYAGAAGKARRAVKIEWDGVTDMTPWRYAMTIAVGLQPPEALMQGTGARYAAMTATAPMLGLPVRAAAADRAAGAGVLSSAAMVDLYSQIYGQEDVDGEWARRSSLLRDAYVGETPEARLAAIQSLWEGTTDDTQRYSRQVLTAYAAARLPAGSDLADDAGPLVASMLSAGLDRNAMRWAPYAEVGSEAWALLSLAAPIRSSAVELGQLESFEGNDDSEGSRKSAFLLAGLAGLGRISDETRKDFAERLEVNLDRQTRWSTLIDQAADVNNQPLVALLAGVGMQGDGWAKMTPRHLYHIVSALRQVGLEAEARMIAAEAVARG